MKVNSINNTSVSVYRKRNQQKQGTPSFRGVSASNVAAGAASLGAASSFLVNLMGAIDRGGLFASFTITDNLGTNVPRTVKGLFRNKEEIGGLNYKAALEEALREYITGPSMFLIPAAIFYGTKKKWGPSTSVDFNLLNSFKNNLKDVDVEKVSDKAGLKRGFFENVAKSVTDDEKTIASVTDSMMKISELKKTDYATKKEYKAAVSGLYEKIADAFAVANKKDAASAINPSIIVVKSGGEVLSKDSQAFAKQAVTFANDVVDKSASVFDGVKKSVTNSSLGDMVEKSVKKVKGAKFASSLVAIASIFSFMTVIPKIYSRSKTYPGSEGLIKNTNNTQPAAAAEKGAQDAGK
ncbi:MAG TPA: hypothetical protein H9673_10380 [Candidatus Adamsella sp.]|nr:hypothetical protein [Candidatus Adamsella sp.]